MHTHSIAFHIRSHRPLYHSHLPTPSFSSFCCYYDLLTALISFTLLLIPPRLFALHLGNYAVFALPPLASVQLAVNWSMQRPVMASYARGAVAMAQLLVVDVTKLHGPRDGFSQKITLIFLRLGGGGTAGAP